MQQGVPNQGKKTVTFYFSIGLLTVDCAVLRRLEVGRNERCQPLPLQSLLTSLTTSLKGVARLAFSARIGRALSHRARSASKKDGLVAPFLSLQARSFLSSKGGLVDPRTRASNDVTDDPSELARHLLGMGAD